MNKIVLLGVMISMFILGGLFGLSLSYEIARGQMENYNDVTNFITDCNTKLLKCHIIDGFYSSTGEWLNIYQNETAWRLDFNGTKTTNTT